MKFLLTNEHLESQISKIKQHIRLSMNGVAADSMRQHGLIYKKNYGVAIPRLREIAAEFPTNHDLAQRLWLLKIRETMILATLIQPAGTFTKEQAFEWLNDCTNSELIEQINLNLFRHLEYAPELAIHCISSETTNHKIAGYILALRIAGNLPIDLQHQITIKAIENAAPREEITTIEYGGARYPQSVDCSPQRRIDLVLRQMTQGAYQKSFNTKNNIVKCLTNEIINAYNISQNSQAISKKLELERQAGSSR